MRETVARIMIELFSNDLVIQYNMNDQKGKMSFGKLHLANLHNHRSQMSISRNKHISPVTVPYLQHAFPYAHTRFSHTCRHIPLHYSLALISLRTTPTHQKHTHTRHRHQSPTINTQTQPPLRTATKQDSQQTLRQSNPNHTRHRNQPRTTQPQVSVWHIFRVAYATRQLNPASAGLRATLATSGFTPPACTCHQPSTNRSTTSHGTVYHEHLLNCMLPKVKFPPVKGTFEIHSVNL